MPPAQRCPPTAPATVTCPDCGGMGNTYSPVAFGGPPPRKRVCDKCGGLGRVPARKEASRE